MIIYFMDALLALSATFSLEYAKAINTCKSIVIRLENILDLLYNFVEQQFRRIIEIQNDILKYYPIRLLI